MRKGILRVGLALMFIFSLSLGVTGQAQAANSTITITAGQSHKFLPRTDGKTVIWSDVRNGTSAIYGANLTDGKEFVVTTGNINALGIDIDNGIVVWQQDEPCPSCKQEIYTKNLATGKVSDLGLGSRPHISGNQVVYLGGFSTNGGEAIQIKGINTMAAPVTLAQTTSPATVADCFAFDGNRALWSEEYIDAERVGHFKLYTIRIGDTGPTLIDQGIGSRITCDLNGDTVVYVDFSLTVKVVNLATGEYRNIGDANIFPSNSRPGNDSDPDTDGRYVFFEQASGTNFSRLDLVGYDIATKSYFGVDTDGSYNNRPNVKNGVLVWVKAADNSTDKNNQLSAAYVTSLLPSAPRPQVPNTADRYYFKDTGHNLAYGFKNFWDKNGTLTVFGFPQTEEFQELNSDTSKVYTVQYFERQRYEYHPENQGTPYEVLLGRLGAADAQRWNLLDTTPFQKVAATSDSNCLYFSETGHKVCGSFMGYWRSHGLDLGDAGVSFRESLALFGLPMSEEFQDPETGLTTQYFERAKFEFHPENKGTPYEVLLGLLGNRELQIRGWQ